MFEPWQQHLERIYEVQGPQRVDDFVLTDPHLADHLDTSENPLPLSEKLLVSEDEDGLSLSLYFDPELVARLAGDDPTVSLHNDNLADFCLALEGVSHFLYVTWNARYERSVTLLELELQAEIDKFVSALFLLARQGRRQVPATLHQWMFEHPVFESGLDSETLERYRCANHYAGKYCAWLVRQYLRPRSRQGFVKDLRRFYRFGQGKKLSRIDHLHA